PPGDDDGEKIPASLLTGQASTPATAATPSPAGPAAGAAPAAAGAAPAAAAVAAPPLKGPEGHTQRLLTVVKAGSIQDVKAQPTDKVHVWPHLLVGEFVAALAMTAFLLVFSAFVNAPLLATANFNFTPNPSKAPWYFLGLQELLTMFHPMVAGVTIPGIGIFGLILAPFSDRNPSQKPEDRKFAIALFTIFLMFWAVLVIIGSFFRGPGFNFILPWRDGLFFDL
ncbi:MAG: menaquinol-cytochrome c reductase cytochrome b subunit, partial [Acidimicrobiia bacterium]|nr:menaquinol-cytochrome c reductase cytochrome b subunit [Acidimicrobiia bacterium]